MNAHSISPMGKNSKATAYNPLPVNCGLQMPPPLAPSAYGRKLEPLSTLNFSNTNNIRPPSTQRNPGSTTGAGYNALESN